MIPARKSRDLQILVVFTGGTISSRVSGGTFAISDPPYQLLDHVSSDDIHFTVCEPFRILSENMTPDMLFHLFCAISDECSSKIYDGILIAHGTDTMAYTAQLAHILLSGLGIPSILIGSKLPLQNPDSDGTVHFANAIALFRQVSSGVYVISRSDNGIIYVHSAGKIMQAAMGTDDFQSYKDQYAGIMEDGRFQIASTNQPDDIPSASLPYLRRLADLRTLPCPETVLVLDSCVGMNFQTLDLTRSEYKYILQRAYHSGTACTAPLPSPYSLLYLQTLCKENFKSLFLAPVDRERIPYSTAQELIHAGVTPVYDLPFEAVWAGLLVCTWLKEKPEEFVGSPG